MLKNNWSVYYYDENGNKKREFVTFERKEEMLKQYRVISVLNCSPARISRN